MFYNNCIFIATQMY